MDVQRPCPKQGMVIHACNPSSQEAEAGGLCEVSLDYIVKPCLKKRQGEKMGWETVSHSLNEYALIGHVECHVRTVLGLSVPDEAGPCCLSQSREHLGCQC
jgi:hypothetical protein